MTAYGCLAALLAAAAAYLAGTWVGVVLFGDSRGLLASLLATLTLALGITLQLHV